MPCCMFGRCSDPGTAGRTQPTREKCSGGVAKGWHPRMALRRPWALEEKPERLLDPLMSRCEASHAACTNLRQWSLVVKTRHLWLRWRRWLHGRVVGSHSRARHVRRCEGGRGIGGLDGHSRHHVAVGLGLLHGAHGRLGFEVIALRWHLAHRLGRRRVVSVKRRLRGHGWCWWQSAAANRAIVVVG